MSSSEAFLSTPSVLYGSLTAGMARSVPLRGHDDARRPQHGLVEAIALLDHVEHDARLGAFGRPRRDRLVDGRVERLAVGLEGRDSAALERANELAVDHLHAAREAVVGVVARSERALEVVDRGQQLA